MALFDFLASKKKPDPPGPDFSSIDSEEKAEALAREGTLAPLCMMPLRFGGEESARNRLLVPPAVVALKDRCDGMVEDLLRQGKVSGYQCRPEYQGTCFIPTAVNVVASQKGEPVFTQRIRIWGDALKEEE